MISLSVGGLQLEFGIGRCGLSVDCDKYHSNLRPLSLKASFANGLRSSSKSKEENNYVCIKPAY